MKQSAKKFMARYRFTTSNRLPAIRSREYIMTYLRENFDRPKDEVTKHAGSLVIAKAWMLMFTTIKHSKEMRIGQRSSCILTARNRSVSGRYNRSRIEQKNRASAGSRFGARKSSW